MNKRFLSQYDPPRMACEITPGEPRLLIIDPNIEGVKGHFLELATVIAEAANNCGINTYLATSRAFATDNKCVKNATVLPTFTKSKISRWSLGPHGYSLVRRDLNGRPVGGNAAIRLWQHCVDRLHGANPCDVLAQISEELAHLIASFRPTANDRLLINTCDDFMLLIVAAAVKRLGGDNRLHISFLQHTPTQAGRACESQTTSRRTEETATQLGACLHVLRDHQLEFLATTRELSQHLDMRVRHGLWHAIDYPIRCDFRPLMSTTSPEPDVAAWGEDILDTTRSHLAELQSISGPLDRSYVRAVCGGAFRSEKGQRQLSQVIRLLWDDCLKRGRWRLGLQMSERDAARLLPRQARGATSGPSAPPFPFDLAKPTLDAEDYVSWIRSADVGLFLYDARRYYTRCSGVLVEMLACGKPVIVPAGSWLSRQIAEVNSRHLQNLAATLPLETPVSLSHTVLQPGRPSRSCQAFVQCSGQASLFTVRLSNATDHSYLAVEAGESGPCYSRTRWHVLEALDGCCRFLITPATDDNHPIRLRFWSPFGERGLKLEQVTVQHVDLDATPPQPGALGITYGRIRDLPACLSEMEMHLQQYQLATFRHAASWRAKHSGKTLLRNATLLGSGAAAADQCELNSKDVA